MLIGLFLAASLLGCGGKDAEKTDGGGTGDAGTACVTCDSVCGEAGCGNGVACTVAGNEEVACDANRCWPGFELKDACTQQAGATCDAEGDESIVDECGVLSRECVEAGVGATCGACLGGYVERDLACVPSETCEAAGCQGQNRLCGLEGATSCGGCAPGFTEVAGLCTANSCDACGLQHRACDETGASPRCTTCLSAFFEKDGMCLPFVECTDLDCGSRVCVDDGQQAYCGTTCTGGLVWDETTESCRAKLGCGVVSATCAAKEMCIEGAPNEDATCVADCPAGSAFATEAAGGPGCFSCSNTSLDCAGLPGATGRVVNVDGNDDGECVCETTTGYFPHDDKTPRECDDDGDGWVNVDAVAFSESTDPGKREQARCEVRRVANIRLEGDDPFHLAPVTIDLVAELPASTGGLGGVLPLYERAANDRTDVAALNQSPVPVGTGGSVKLAPAVLNSLTKACVIDRNDFNLNRLADRTEQQLDRPNGTVLGGVPAVAVPWFGQYTRFSYFIELAEGWFEAPNTYVIAERPRDPMHSPGRERIALVRTGETLGDPGFESPATGARYWRACGRHDDEIGGDFSSEHLNTAPDEVPAMFHHSQFRCVYPTTAGGYPDVNHAGNSPALAFWSNGVTSASLSWREHDAETPVVFAEGNTCWPTGTTTYQRPAADAEGPNPESHGFTCAASIDRTTDPLATEQLVWAVVGYTSHRGVAAEISSQEPTPYPYLRGCLNTCAEYGVDFCPTWDAANPSPGFVCDGDNPDLHGEILCGCGGDFSGPGTSCGLACGGDATFNSPGMDIFNRADFDHWTSVGTPGYWACIEPSRTSTQVAGKDVSALGSATTYLLRGGVPASIAVAVDIPATGGATYRLRSRARAQVQIAVVGG